ncbi:hypothetical protein HF072_16970 [Bacillus sp. RO3]|nr:hypothetical protein [Bacillus sp. RO3]
MSDDDACQFPKRTPAIYEHGGKDDEEIRIYVTSEEKMAFREDPLQPGVT